jgi:DNA-binding CsgD family transcriptional regulator
MEGWQAMIEKDLLTGSNLSLDVLLQKYVILKKEKYLDDIFSPAEKEIFLLLEQGCNKAQMSYQLNKSVSTLKNQISGMLRKVNAKNCTELVSKVSNQFLR